MQAGDEHVESEIETSFKLKPSKKKSVTEESITLEQPVSETPKEEEQISQQITLKPGMKSVSLKLPDVSEAKICDAQFEAPRKASIKSVSLETPLVTEEGLPQAGDEQVESSFKLKPSKRTSVTEESITLEQPASVTLQEEQVGSYFLKRFAFFRSVSHDCWSPQSYKL